MGERKKRPPLPKGKDNPPPPADITHLFPPPPPPRREALPLSEALAGLRSRDALVATFLALLELIRLQAVAARQKDLFGEILLRKYRMFDEVVARTQRGVDEGYQ